MWEEETATVKCPCTLIQFAGGVFASWTLEDNTWTTMADLNEAVRNRGAYRVLFHRVDQGQT